MSAIQFLRRDIAKTRFITTVHISLRLSFTVLPRDLVARGIHIKIPRRLNLRQLLSFAKFAKCQVQKLPFHLLSLRPPALPISAKM
jgi:hypothetical protein